MAIIVMDDTRTLGDIVRDIEEYANNLLEAHEDATALESPNGEVHELDSDMMQYVELLVNDLEQLVKVSQSASASTAEAHPLH